MKYEVAGDPVTGLLWTRKTTEKIAEELKSLDIDVSPSTVCRLLTQMGFSLRTNQKNISAGNPANRNKQFEHIKELRERFESENLPVVSVDTKKKELVGNFKNPGKAWHRASPSVNDHDFRSYALGMAIPYGIYDNRMNRGYVCVGTSRDTPEFAVDNIGKWWCEEGSVFYPTSKSILILADGGGSNSSSSRAWKYGIQKNICDRHGITVYVCHYPPGTSKWNPIEHRLFSEISKNWAGRPLDSYETVLNYIRTTTTSTGLKVKARLVEKEYEKGIKITDDQMEELCISKNEDLPKWNYILQPSKMGS